MFVAILVALASLLGIYLLARLWLAIRFMTNMPGKSYRGKLPPATDFEKELASGLSRHVEKLAGEIGDRHRLKAGTLEKSAAYIRSAFTAIGYQATDHEYTVGTHTYTNIEAERAGLTDSNEVIVIGAHYDTYFGSPGANDNASGIAAVLELARLFASRNPAKTIRFVAFAQEERPNAKIGAMGSQAYARRCHERGEKVTVLAMETMGYYSDKLFSQLYPPPFTFLYPTRGNFIGFIGNLRSRELVRRCIKTFRETTQFPSEGVASWDWIPGVGSSDHEPFWHFGYQGLMVTDTAPFRYPHYHSEHDTPDKLDYDRFSRVMAGMFRVVIDLAG